MDLLNQTFPKAKLALEKLRTLATLKYKSEYGYEVANAETQEGIYRLLTSKDFRLRFETFSDDEIADLFTDHYNNDIEFYRQREHDLVQIRKDINGNEKKKWFFVTVGFDDKQVGVVNNMKSFLTKFKLTPGIDIQSYVCEKFRKNDKAEIYVHHHIHFLIHTDFPKSKVIQFCFQKAKGFIGGKQFIDVKNDGEISRYEKYIKGDKIESKKECCELDRIWRIEVGL